ncbi:MAG: acetyl-CoA carboxylase biotin carboxylase subunit [Spirochaetia bacterium]|nr:acetyl-CoA carboxylase biotin carboxylase subunit [Spirochaetia bacterium]
MFKKVLIANRSEIATRVIRACKELDIATVAIFSEPDSEAIHVKKADEAYLVGPGPVEGYLNVAGIVELAQKVGADAIHPGYGFLAENPKLPLFCEKKGITFIGPSSEVISLMGDKIEAKRSAIKAGIITVPGSEGSVTTDEEALKICENIGYPVMVKATGGGGGRGLRVVNSRDELINSISVARSEAKGAFGNTEIFIEKYIERPHHIEFQILADKYGNTIHLGERDCSIQRRHQKIIEIAPSLILDEKLRQKMGEAAIAISKSVNYTNAGTVEFLVDKNNDFYFIEMNTRIQVEHTVTEAVTGIDIVKKQIEIAAGLPLEIKQEDVQIRGYAIECRINAEDPKKDFMPNVGKVSAYYSPGGIGVRIDGAAYKDYVIPGYFDSMLAKLTVSGMTWQETVARMRRSLSEFTLRGVKTTIPYQLEIMKNEKFIKGDFDTSFIAENPQLMEYKEYRDSLDIILALAAAIAAHEGL